MNLTDPVSALEGVGPKYVKKLEKLAIFSIQDLLNYFPINYTDSSEVVCISELMLGKKYTIKATVKKIENVFIRNRKSIQKAVVFDSTGSIDITWFNQPFLVKTINEGDCLLINGKVSQKTKSKLTMLSPSFELHQNTNQAFLGTIAPNYKLTSGVSQKYIRKLQLQLNSYLIKNQIDDLKENLTIEITQRFDLLDIFNSYIQIHFPKSNQEIIEARKRLAFNELLEIQLKLLKSKILRQKQKSKIIKIDNKKIARLINNLPFQLNFSQKKAIQEILNDLSQNKPMRRMLQGDVGSGKTIVAIIASYATFLSTKKTVVMAPTTVLAQQLYLNFKKFLPKDIQIDLLTSSEKSDYKKTDILIGTQAILFSKNIAHIKPALIIIDEQHRFGVKQRAVNDFLSNTNKLKPHILQMTATPIPRTLALSLFADVDVSTLEVAKFKSLAQTKVLSDNKRDDLINWLKTRILAKEQIFWIFPRIESTDNGVGVLDGFKSINAYFKKGQVKLLHGKMKEAEKNRILKSFNNDDFSILVSTSVIEVGIDSKKASVIIIEEAEKFGLAQLHQLRGRVGRRGQKSWCFLIPKQFSEKSLTRLNFFTKESNGITLAEFDLRSRGPGEVYGVYQSGLPSLKIAKFGNITLMKQTNLCAKLILNYKT